MSNHDPYSDSPEPFGWIQHHQSLLGHRSPHCHGINFALRSFERNRDVSTAIRGKCRFGGSHRATVESLYGCNPMGTKCRTKSTLTGR